jgi:citrate synthase
MVMKVENQNQFGHEHTAWQRKLDFLMQENALLKYRLSEIVDCNEEKGFLQMAEYFQNELLLKDEALNKLIKKLKIFADQFHVQNDRSKLEEIIKSHDELRNCISQLEKEFLHLSNQFNQKMLRSIKH